MADDVATQRRDDSHRHNTNPGTGRLARACACHYASANACTSSGTCTRARARANTRAGSRADADIRFHDEWPCRPRPISLKTDVIKSRNRVKTMRPDLASKKKQQQQQQQQQQHANFNGANDPNGLDIHGQRRHSHKPSNGNVDGSDSPVSRTATPNLYNPSLPVFQSMDDAQLQGLSGFNVGANDNRSGSPLNGDRHLDVPQTHEQLIAANSALKTRVSELELINELFRGRLSQMEQDEASARRGQEVSGKAEAQLRAQLEASKKQLEESHRRENNLKRRLDELELENSKKELEESHRRENNLKRRLDELELELKDTKEALDASDSGPAAKKLRVADVVAGSEVSTPQSTTTTT
ncbi:GATA type zinc finger protein asd-4 [Colletotrichum spinosum]|uniref:GATA type zinc finger protein asd-4 n=1 Tax=Colletotrichum spinosum TaxID=1347390 RepID=A0A4V3HT94_9PEZI|nr:GATA type zinc finger protein asd-4 [Colletotrichum spinosum]